MLERDSELLEGGGSRNPGGQSLLRREEHEHAAGPQAEVVRGLPGEPLHETMDPDFNLDAMAILDAGIRSAETAKLEMVDNIYWRASRPPYRG